MRQIYLLLIPAIAASAAQDAGECEEGTTWKMDCNSCTCMKGRPACTEMACLPPQGGGILKRNGNRFVRSEDLVKPNSYKQNCKPDDRWKDEDCNNCRCQDIDGRIMAVCTKRKCPGGQTLTPTPGWQDTFNILNQERRKRTPTIIVMDKFRRIDKRQRFRRSDDLVVKPNSYKQGCLPGDIWKDQDCNTCTCDDILDPHQATCTKRVCPDGKKLTPTPGWENAFNTALK